MKRGKSLTSLSRTLIDEKLQLLKETAQQLGIPCWHAPAEAEAECANMLRMGIVDAIWSEDSDVFMFRGDAVLRFHYNEAGNKLHKDNVLARKYRMSAITEKRPLMDWRGLVLFAVLVGGDYDMRGLPGCGPKIALEAVSKGFGSLLVEAFKRKTLATWRQSFQDFLLKNGSTLAVPVNFPNPQVLKNYMEPRVSSASELQAGICWTIPVDHHDLRHLICTRFNFSVQEYLRWVPRMIISRKLLGLSEVDELGLQFTRTVSTAESGNISMSKVSFSMGAIVDRGILVTWPKKETIDLRRIKPYAHQERVECDIPDAIIKRAAPELLDGKRPYKGTNETNKLFQSHNSGEKRKRGRPRKEEAQRVGDGQSGESSVKRKRGRPRKDEAETVATLPERFAANVPDVSGRKRQGLWPITGNNSKIDTLVPLKKNMQVEKDDAEASRIHDANPGDSSELDSDEEFPDISKLQGKGKTSIGSSKRAASSSFSRGMSQARRNFSWPSDDQPDHITSHHDSLSTADTKPSARQKRWPLSESFSSPSDIRPAMGDSHRRGKQQPTAWQTWDQVIDLTDE